MHTNLVTKILKMTVFPDAHHGYYFRGSCQLEALPQALPCVAGPAAPYFTTQLADVKSFGQQAPRRTNCQLRLEVALTKEVD